MPIHHILKKTGVPDLLELLAERLSSSELNTLLLEVFRRKAARVSPAGLMRAYRDNRFVHPSGLNALAFAEYALAWMKAAAGEGFYPLRLGPVGPLGCCSAVATVHQDKILSALRGMEVTSDASNILALESSRQRQEQGFPPEALHFSCIHQHLRTPPVKMPGHSAHFTLLVLTSAGRDTGNFDFEKENLYRHLHFYRKILSEKFQHADPVIRLKIYQNGQEENRRAGAVVEFLQNKCPDWITETAIFDQTTQNYYQDLQFKVILPGPHGQNLEIADGGFVPWTRMLTGNRKERFLISGLGVEMMFKIFSDQ